MPVAIFTDGGASTRRRGGHGVRRAGWIILLLAVVGIVIFGLLPAPYAIEQPGPVFNVLGTTTVAKKTVDVIQVPKERKSYPTTGTLDALTVNVIGDPTDPPSWFQLAQAWFQPSQTVVPMNELYAPNETVQQSNQQGAAEMTNSQQDATAAALFEQGIRFTSTITVAGTEKGFPAASVLKKGDIITSVNGKTFVDSDQLHTIVVAAGVSKPMTIHYVRDGEKAVAKVTPVMSTGADPEPFLGVLLTEKYSFPFDVKIQLQDVGGPSAGQMFALGLIDKLTPGSLNGGQKIAGTGTISPSGAVGAIGGIRQKMYGARDAGAKYFLAPKSNCDEVSGHIPSGLTVYATSSLSESVSIVKTIADQNAMSSLPTCPAG